MDTIKTYLDNVFAAFPQTDKVQTIKRDIFAGMEEKYLTLRQQGSSENEAVGIVIANFGSIDEIAQELGETEKTPQLTAVNNSVTVIAMSLHDARRYVSQSRGVGYACGIAFFMFTIGFCVALISQTADSLGVMMPLIIGGMVILIITAYRATKDFEAYQTANISLDPVDHMALAEDKSRFNGQAVIIGVGVIIAVLSCMVLALEGYTNIPLVIVSGFAFFRLPIVLTSKIAYDYLLGKWIYKSGRWVYMG